MLRAVKNYIQKLNLFPSIPPTNDEYELRTQRISTRIFICLFITGMTILLLYTSLIKIQKTTTILNPIYEELHSNLVCSCKSMSIYYKEFLRIEYSLHQVCTSLFVKTIWIDALRQSFLTSHVYTIDFRERGMYAFQALQMFCELINETIVNELTTFYSNQYISASMKSLNIFQKEIESLSNELRRSMINNFHLSRSMIRDATRINSLISNNQFNNPFKISPNRKVRTVPPEILGCQCRSLDSCLIQQAIYHYPSQEIVVRIPAFYIGCYTIEALLSSSLVCFYDQQCINDILKYVPIDVQVDKLSKSNRYLPNSTIEYLVDELMLETWNVTTDYKRYFHVCQPQECTHTYETRNYLIYIFTSLFGIAGGLITVLKIFIPNLVKLIRRRKRENSSLRISRSYLERIEHLFSKVKYYLFTYNMFPSTNEDERRNQRISTRLFICLFVIGMTTLLIYNSLIQTRKTFTISNPSFTEYKQYYSSYSQTFSCQCTNISINYAQLMFIDYSFHQICTSAFIDSMYINNLIQQSNTLRLLTPKDFRWTAPEMFQALRSFCHLINDTIANHLATFYSKQYVRTYLTPEHILKEENHFQAEQLRSSIENSFLFSRSMIRDTTQMNVLTSSLETQIEIEINNQTNKLLVDSVRNMNCSRPAFVIIEDAQERNIFVLPGFHIGCYVIKALLQSSLICLYELQCVEFIHKLPSIEFACLDPLKSSRFFPNLTVQRIVDELMLETWNEKTTYEKYYNACQPIECTYVLQTKHDLVYIFTTLFGIAGGLMIILEFLVPKLVELKSSNITRQWKFFRELNLYPSNPPSIDTNELRIQRISTRIFGILFILIMTILLLYTALIIQIKTETISKPSLKKYQQLYPKYSKSLTCPCRNISINYGQFVNVDYRLHQVCHSIFVDHIWIKYLTMPIDPYDFRTRDSYSFQALRMFCELINEMIANHLVLFYSSRFVSASLKHSSLLQKEINSLTDQLRLSMIKKFLISRSIIRDTTQVNSLFSYSCVDRSIIQQYPDFYVGCYIIEALLRSSLVCFYNQTCVEEIRKYYWNYNTSAANIQSLDPLKFSRYFPNSTIKTLVNELMLENWTMTFNYEKYFNICQPIHCTYNYELRNDVIYIVTTLFGLAGGVTTVLDILVPRMIKLIMKYIYKHDNTVLPSIS